ncbi:ABC transporter ATP-binding protein [uncultured Roseobacter sp.]|uniref:ABC transporter ATP-binding protein n=1 Tax=uncultured Roseobacter sp. TaxID=114847 RepID=UPI0026187300|nr:ABC transporter ATP-binding protein [uncultured Roseobacter sp.]
MFTTYKKLISLLNRRERKRFALLFIMVIVSSVLETGGVALMLPFLQVLSDPGEIQSTAFLKFFYDTLGFTSAQSFSLFMGSCIFAFLVIGIAFKAVTLYALTRFGVMRAFGISTRLLKSSLYQPYIWFVSRHSSALTTSVLTEVNQLVSGSLLPALQILPNLLTILLIVGFIVAIEPVIAILAVVLLGGTYGLIYAGMRGLIGRLGHQRMIQNKRRFHTVQEATGGIKELKLMGLEQAYMTRFESAAFRMAKIQSVSVVVRQLPRFALEAIAFGGMIMMLLFLIARGGGNLAEVLPTFGFFVLAFGRLLPALQQIYSKFSQLRFNDAVLTNIHKEINALVMPKESDLEQANAQPPMGLKTSLALRNVSYQYPAAERAALHDMSLQIPANTTVGIVGGTGAGKTTAIDVMLGLLTPDAGTLEVDGTAVDTARLRAWQKSIGYVPQQIFLTDDTVAHNIAFGAATADIDMEAVTRAAKIASLHNFVETELPEGYQTHVGERGVRLSGGQRQRIGIARALYHDPDVLILDEATSALDNITERAVMEAVHNIGGKKTIIMIAHRLSTVKNCDEIFMLAGGKVLASGRFDDLMQNSPEFREMAKQA